MLKFTVIAVGKLGERHWTDACAEYQKRLGAFCKAEIVEVDEHRLPTGASPSQVLQALEAEGGAILQRIPSRAHVTALCIEGQMLSSQKLAATLARLPDTYSHLVFVIGGSHGLSDAVKARAGLRLSMSPMTFPHQLARVLLLEQIYRGFSINHGTKYHK